MSVMRLEAHMWTACLYESTHWFDPLFEFCGTWAYLTSPIVFSGVRLSRPFGGCCYESFRAAGFAALLVLSWLGECLRQAKRLASALRGDCAAGGHSHQALIIFDVDLAFGEIAQAFAAK